MFKNQTYRAYKESRDRRAAYAERYKREKLRGPRRETQLERWSYHAIMSPIFLPIYLIRRLVRAIRRPSPALAEIREQGSWQVEVREDDELLRSAEELGIDLSPDSLRAAARQPVPAGSGPRVSGGSHIDVEGTAMKGFTHREFEGQDAGTVRFWFDWWRDPARSKDGVEEAGRHPKVEAARCLAELEARSDAGQLTNPPGGVKDAMKMEIRFDPR
jgi:hypothetical protein